MDLNDPNFLAYLASLSDDDRKAMFQPFGQQGDMLQQQLIQAQALQHPQSGEHSTGMGAALGGLGDVLSGVSGNLQTHALQQQMAKLLAGEQGEASNRVGNYAKFMQLHNQMPGAGAGDVGQTLPFMLG